MRSDARGAGWRRWREAVFATCTAWLLLQNLALITIVAWSRPESAWAAGAALTRAATAWGGSLLLLSLGLSVGLALAAYLVHAPARAAASRAREVRDGR